jgi:hypothetical protein
MRIKASYLAALMIALFAAGGIGHADEVDDKTHELQQLRDKAAALIMEKDKTQQVLLKSKRILAQIDRFNATHQGVMAGLKNSLLSFNQKFKAYKSAQEKDRAEMSQMVSWMQDALSSLNTENLKKEHLLQKRREYQSLRSSTSACSASRASAVTNELDKIVANQMRPLLSLYQNARKDLPMEHDYREFQLIAENNEKFIKQKYDEAFAAMVAMQDDKNYPEVCRKFYAMDSILSLLDTLVLIRETGDNLQLESMKVDAILANIQSQEKAIAYARDARKMLIGYGSLFARSLTLNNIEKALELSERSSASIGLIMQNISGSPFLSKEQRNDLIGEANKVLESIKNDTRSRLYSDASLRNMLLVRTQSLAGLLNRLNRELPDAKKGEAWRALVDFCKKDLQMEINRRYRLPAFDSREELLSFSKKVGQAESLSEPLLK